MTREEAIKILSELPDRIIAVQLPFDINYDYKEAITKAVSILSEEEKWNFYYDHGYAQAERDLSKIKEDMVSREMFEQIMWERDLAIQQLKDLGYGLGEKPKENDDDTMEWIQHIDPRFDNSGRWLRKCSKCGYVTRNYGHENFCPNCGRRKDWVEDMRG